MTMLGRQSVFSLRSGTVMVSLFFLLFLFLPVSAMAKVPAGFVDIGYGCRPLGMGGAYVALADDANSVLWNPGGLVQMEKRECTFMYTRQKGLIPYQYFAYGQSMAGVRGAGVAVIVSGDGALSEYTLQTAYAVKGYLVPGMKWMGRRAEFIRKVLEKTDIGVGVKFRYARFGNNTDGGDDRVTGSALGGGLDIGLMMEMNYNVKIGLAVKDFLAPLWWRSSASGTYNEPLMTKTVFGIRYQIPDKMVITSDIDNFYKVSIGIEKRFFRYIDLRGGYRQDLSDNGTEKEYTMGMGIGHIDIKGIGFSFDMSYGFERLADTWRASSSFRF